MQQTATQAQPNVTTTLAADGSSRLSPRSQRWSRRESNPRPLECDSSALPTELRPHREQEPEQGRGYNAPRRVGQPARRGPSGGTLVAVDPREGGGLAEFALRAPKRPRCGKT